jgi:hypothetical protein
MRPLAVALVVLMLAGCAPASIAPGPSSPPAATPSATPADPEPTADPAPPAPEDVAATSFLLDGTPGVADADGFWKGHYGFFTDASKTVRCDIWIFSGDSGGVTCGVTPGNEGLVTYALPAADCDPSGPTPADGYTVAINFKVFSASNTGFSGCGGADVDPALASATNVLLDNQTLRIPTAVYTYTCTVLAGVASCDDSFSGASIRYGLGVAEFAG